MKIMITTRGDFVSPRFDLSPEVIIATFYDRQLLEEPRSIIISDVSAVIICDLALQENVATVICGGITVVSPLWTLNHRLFASFQAYHRYLHANNGDLS